MLLANQSLTWEKIAAGLEAVVRQGPAPRSITVDNGTEFTSRAMEPWAYQHQIHFDFIRPGKPVENAVIESFNGRLRDECSNANLFISLHDARQKIEAWRIDYNVRRPHGSLGNLTFMEFSGKGEAISIAEGQHF